MDEGGTEGGGGRVVEGEVYLPPTFFSLETNYPLTIAIYSKNYMQCHKLRKHEEGGGGGVA